MLFDTHVYGVFLAIVFYTFWLLHRHRTLGRIHLLAASYFFYACWNVAYLGLILFSTVLDHVLGRAIYAESRPGRRKLYLALSLIGNLGVLATFKYLLFLTANLNFLTGLFGLEPIVPLVDLLLPVGISFYTFQTLSYTIEIYQGKTTPRASFIDFALFVSFFPQLVAGPIVRASVFMPQLDTPRRLDRGDIGTGLFLIQKGLFKKIVIADFIGINLVDPVFLAPGAYSGLAVLLAIYGFRLQLYGDFSGYSDIAIGSARLFGFRLPENFRSPYKATSIPDYWRRWHITMSTWFRDFLFFPLGGSRGSQFRTCVNLVLTMALVGLWHGASWTFVAWGTYYGVLLAIWRLIKTPWAAVRERIHPALRIFLGWVLTLNLTSIGSLIFRAESMLHVRSLLSRFMQFDMGRGVSASCLLVLLLGYGLHLCPEGGKAWCGQTYRRWPAVAQAATLAALFVLISVLGLKGNPFYYFQF